MPATTTTSTAPAATAKPKRVRYRPSPNVHQTAAREAVLLGLIQLAAGLASEIAVDHGTRCRCELCTGLDWPVGTRLMAVALSLEGLEQHVACDLDLDPARVSADWFDAAAELRELAARAVGL
jgi:hypothetical protein